MGLLFFAEAAAVVLHPHIEHDRTGKDIIKSLIDETKQRQNITVCTNAEIIEKKGCVGNFDVKLRIEKEEDIRGPNLDGQGY